VSKATDLALMPKFGKTQEGEVELGLLFQTILRVFAADI
jgi:hypothetical protein